MINGYFRVSVKVSRPKIGVSEVVNVIDGFQFKVIDKFGEGLFVSTDVNREDIGVVVCLRRIGPDFIVRCQAPFESLCV